MIIQRLNLYRYELPLTRPLHIGSRIFDTRSGLIVSFTDDEGFSGAGEIAPLPGLHRESISGCIKQLQDLKAGGRLDRFETSDLKRSWGIHSFGNTVFPSVTFGIDSALLQLRAVQTGKRVAALFTSNPQKRIPVNALLTDETQTGAFSGSGYTTFKIKAGRRSLKEEIGWIQNIALRLPAGARLRIDANCRWDLNRAVQFCQALEGLPVEYIEEPLQDSRELPALAEKISFRIALDENLPAYLDRDLPDWVGAVVVKPAVFPVLDRLAAVREKDIPVVISDTFQTGAGILMLAELAAALDQGDLAMGLDTLSWLSEDILLDRPVIKNGALDCRSPVSPADLDLSRLEEIKI